MAASLPNGRQLSAHCCYVAGFDERRRTQIELGDMGGNADDRHDRRAQEAKDHDLEMGSAIRTVHGVVHSEPRRWPGWGGITDRRTIHRRRRLHASIGDAQVT